MQKTFQLSRATEIFSKHAHAHHRAMNNSSCVHHTTSHSISFPPFKTYSNSIPLQCSLPQAVNQGPDMRQQCYLRFPNSVILTYVSNKSYFCSILHNKVIFRKARGLVIAELTIFYHKCFSTLYTTRQA